MKKRTNEIRAKLPDELDFSDDIRNFGNLKMVVLLLVFCLLMGGIFFKDHTPNTKTISPAISAVIDQG